MRNNRFFYVIESKHRQIIIEPLAEAIHQWINLKGIKTEHIQDQHLCRQHCTFHFKWLTFLQILCQRYHCCGKSLVCITTRKLTLVFFPRDTAWSWILWEKYPTVTVCQEESLTHPATPWGLTWASPVRSWIGQTRQHNRCDEYRAQMTHRYMYEKLLSTYNVFIYLGKYL